MYIRFLLLSFILFSQTVFAIHIDGLAPEKTTQEPLFTFVTLSHQSIDAEDIKKVIDTDIIHLNPEISDELFDEFYELLKYDYAHFYLFEDHIIASKYELEDFDYTVTSLDFVLKDGVNRLGHFYLTSLDQRSFVSQFYPCASERVRVDVEGEYDTEGNSSLDLGVSYSRENDRGSSHSFNVGGSVSRDSQGDVNGKVEAGYSYDFYSE